MRVLFVDDDVQILRGLARMIECEVEEWEVETAESGAEALAILAEEQFEVIVSDMRMPSMDGAELLQVVEQQFPEVMRLVLSGQADCETVMRGMMPMHQFLSKPCDKDILIQAIRRAETLYANVDSLEVLAAIGQANYLPAPAQVVKEIQDELNSEHCSSSSLAHVVSREPLLVAQILKLANSAIFGLRQPVTDVEKGISTIGVDVLSSLALALSMFPDEGNESRWADRVFKHSTQVATIGKRLAVHEKLDSEATQLIASAGLLHDIGKLVLLNAFGERYKQLFDAGVDRIESSSERDEFGVSHAVVGAYLLQMWGVPERLTDIVATHHSPLLCAESSIESQVVFAANWIAGDCVTDWRSALADSENVKPSVHEFLDRLERWKAENEEFLEKQEK